VPADLRAPARRCLSNAHRSSKPRPLRRRDRDRGSLESPGAYRTSGPRRRPRVPGRFRYEESAIKQNGIRLLAGAFGNAFRCLVIAGSVTYGRPSSGTDCASPLWERHPLVMGRTLRAPAPELHRAEFRSLASHPPEMRRSQHINFDAFQVCITQQTLLRRRTLPPQAARWRIDRGAPISFHSHARVKSRLSPLAAGVCPRRCG